MIPHCNVIHTSYIIDNIKIYKGLTKILLQNIEFSVNIKRILKQFINSIYALRIFYLESKRSKKRRNLFKIYFLNQAYGNLS